MAPVWSALKRKTSLALRPRVLTVFGGCLAKEVDGARSSGWGCGCGAGGVTGLTVGAGGVSDPQLPGATKTVPEALGGSQAPGAGKDPPSIASSAPTASIRPPPTAQGPKVPTAAALEARASRTSPGEAPGSSSRSSAAAPAAWGAAAEVPQKRQTPGSDFGCRAKKVVAPQSVAATSGLESTSGVGSAAAGPSL